MFLCKRLWGQTPGEPRSDCELDWEHDHRQGIEDPGRTRPADLANGHPGCGCGSSETEDRKGGLPRRVELPDLVAPKVTMLLVRTSLDWLNRRRAQRDKGATASIFCRAASFPHSTCPAWECQAASTRQDLLSTPFRTGAKSLSILPLQGSNQDGR